MPHSLTLPLVAAASLVGATAGGIALGHSTIAEINPKHFAAGEDSQFYADLAPNRRADWGQVAATELQQAASAPPPVTDPAATWPVAPIPVHDPAVDRALAQAWREVRAPAPAPAPRYVEPVAYEAAARPDPIPARVRRYASYPVSRDEPPPPPPPEEDDGPAGDAATQ
ncbi:MAG: hypothetical protein JO013_07675 [Alphaproteobacteria bacterium]|nr:hypothetical protein [Alphaproteobacteria bacterium]